MYAVNSNLILYLIAICDNPWSKLDVMIIMCIMSMLGVQV